MEQEPHARRAIGMDQPRQKLRRAVIGESPCAGEVSLVNRAAPVECRRFRPEEPTVPDHALHVCRQEVPRSLHQGGVCRDKHQIGARSLRFDPGGAAPEPRGRGGAITLRMTGLFNLLERGLVDLATKTGIRARRPHTSEEMRVKPVRIRVDLAGKEEIGRRQKIAVIVMEHSRQSAPVKALQGQRHRADSRLGVGAQHRLKEPFIRDPRPAKEPLEARQIGVRQKPLQAWDRQAPPLQAKMRDQPLRHRPPDAHPALQIDKRIEHRAPAFPREWKPKRKPLNRQPALDPGRIVRRNAFDKVDASVAPKKFRQLAERAHRQAGAAEKANMVDALRRLEQLANTIQRRLDQTEHAPFGLARGNDCRLPRQITPQLGDLGAGDAPVDMDRNGGTGPRQMEGERLNPAEVFMRKKNKARAHHTHPPRVIRPRSQSCCQPV